MLPNGSFAVGLVTGFTGVYCVLLGIKNRTEIAQYGRKAELSYFGDFRNFTLGRNYDQELSLRLREKQKEQQVSSDFALFTNKITSQVSDTISNFLK